jgi:hypothetical protein
LKVFPELVVLVPVGVVCQYHVSPAGGVPLLVNVTPASAHCGELDVGFTGSAGNGLTTTAKLPTPLLQQSVVLF